MKTFDEIKAEYMVKELAWQKEDNYLAQKIAKYEAKIKLLHKLMFRSQTKKTNNWSKNPSWVKELVNPIAELLHFHYPNRSLEILGPFGLRSYVAIYLIKDNAYHETREKALYAAHFAGDNILSVTLVPGDLSKGELYYETGARINEFNPGTIGEINGMNHVSEPLDSIDPLLAILAKQCKDLSIPKE